MSQSMNSKSVRYGSWGWPSSMLQRIEHRRMSDSEREAAAESLREGELIAEFMLRSGVKLHSAAAQVGSFFLHRTH